MDQLPRSSLTRNLMDVGGPVYGELRFRPPRGAEKAHDAMASLGYGDINPVADTAWALAALEAMFGRFYIAILVAGLVASYVQRSEVKCIGR